MWLQVSCTRINVFEIESFMRDFQSTMSAKTGVNVVASELYTDKCIRNWVIYERLSVYNECQNSSARGVCTFEQLCICFTIRDNHSHYHFLSLQTMYALWWDMMGVTITSTPDYVYALWWDMIGVTITSTPDYVYALWWDMIGVTITSTPDYVCCTMRHDGSGCDCMCMYVWYIH